MRADPPANSGKGVEEFGKPDPGEPAKPQEPGQIEKEGGKITERINPPLGESGTTVSAPKIPAKVDGGAQKPIERFISWLLVSIGIVAIVTVLYFWPHVGWKGALLIIAAFILMLKESHDMWEHRGYRKRSIKFWICALATGAAALEAWILPGKLKQIEDTRKESLVLQTEVAHLRKEAADANERFEILRKQNLEYEYELFPPDMSYSKFTNGLSRFAGIQARVIVSYEADFSPAVRAMSLMKQCGWHMAPSDQGPYITVQSNISSGVGIAFNATTAAQSNELQTAREGLIDALFSSALIGVARGADANAPSNTLMIYWGKRYGGKVARDLRRRWESNHVEKPSP